MKILVINTGSSSIKYKLFSMGRERVIATGLLEKIGEGESKLTHHTMPTEEGADKICILKETPIKDHAEGLSLISSVLMDSKNGVIKSKADIDAIGHRVVHGGEVFRTSAVVNDAMIETVKEMSHLAPLHNPPNLIGLNVARKIFPETPQVGVFDTAFHQTMPAHAFQYAIPYDLYKKFHVRRYGFHGTSHLYVSKEAARFLKKKVDEVNLITIHIGNGCSMAAIRKGKSADTTMGMTPLEGLVMGTRCGDIDPAIPFFLSKELKVPMADIDNLLNKKSGLKGICGFNDLRNIEKRKDEGDSQAKLAIEMYCYRIKKYIGAYYAALGQLDAIVFTAGVGENQSSIRANSCSHLENLGIIIDSVRNEARLKTAREISTESSPVKVLVIPTDEELEIARETREVLQNQHAH